MAHQKDRHINVHPKNAYIKHEKQITICYVSVIYSVAFLFSTFTGNYKKATQEVAGLCTPRHVHGIGYTDNT